MMLRRRAYYSLLFFVTLVTFWLVVSTEKKYYRSAPHTLQIVTTTGMIGDVVKQIVGDQAEVIVLMKPGVDPHSYEATIRDAWALAASDIIFFNGAHLEGGMHDPLAMLAKNGSAYAVGDALDPTDWLTDPYAPQVHDPHFWLSVPLWSKVTPFICQRLQAAQEKKSPNPLKASLYETHAAAYLSELQQLHEKVQHDLAHIPPSSRVIITPHSFCGYFCKTYGFEMQSLQGISTVTEASTQKRVAIRKLIIERNIRGIFTEFSSNPKGIQALQEDCQKIHAHQVLHYELYSDTLGEEGTPEGTYEGMILYNLATFIKALTPHEPSTENTSP